MTGLHSKVSEQNGSFLPRGISGDMVESPNLSTVFTQTIASPVELLAGGTRS